MSILQEYEEYRQKLGEEEWNNIEQFLEEHDQYYLSDVLYKERVWKIYEDWKNGKFTRKSNIKSSGNDIVDNLMYLTQNMWFEPIDKFSDVIYNGAEIMNSVDLSDCVEFGTNNGQELLIYDTTSDDRKHIKYFGTMTTIFDELVITHLYSKSGKVYEADYDAIWDELAAINNWNGDSDYDEVESSVNMVRKGSSNMKINRKKNNIKSSRKIKSRRPVKASTIMGAMDTENLTIYVPSYCYVVVMVDSYEQGEGEKVNSWTFQVADGFRTAQELIDDIAESSGIFSNDINDYVVLDSSLQTDATVNAENDIPTEEELEAWKRGELELYVAHLWVRLQVGLETHDMTEDEAEAFGLSVY